MVLMRDKWLNINGSWNLSMTISIEWTEDTFKLNNQVEDTETS